MEGEVLTFASNADTWSTAGSRTHRTQLHSSFEAFSGLDPTEGSGYDAIMDLVSRCVEENVPIADGTSVVVRSSELLGAGAAAEVFGGTLSGRPVAVKKFRFRLPSNPDSPAIADPNFRRMLREAKMEIRIMANQYLHSHGNICRLLAVHFVPVQNALQPMLILEKAECTLSQCLRGEKFTSPRDHAKILSDIAVGLSAIHNLNIVHGDLKPSNCLLFVSPNGTPIGKISDFGYSRDMNVQRPAQYRWGTRFWTPPECLDSAPKDIAEQRDLSSRDVYSFGMIMVTTVFSDAALRHHGWPDHDIFENTAIDPWEILSKFDAQKVDGKLESISASLVDDHFQVLRDGTSLTGEDATANVLIHSILRDANSNERPQAVRISSLRSESSGRAGFEGSPHVAEEVPLAYVCMAECLRLNPRDRPLSGGLEFLFKSHDQQTINRMLSLPTRTAFVFGDENLRINETIARESFNALAVPSTMRQYIFNLTTRELNRLEGSPEASPPKTRSTLLNNLALCYHWAIGTEPDAQKAADHTLQAARCGSFAARYRLLMRSSLRGEPISGLELFERLNWTLQILLAQCPPGNQAALEKALTFTDDLQSSVDLCSYSLVATFGRMYCSATYRVIRKPDSDILSCITKDNALELRELLKTRSTDINSEKFPELISDILMVSAYGRRYSILREILRWLDLEGDIGRVAEALSACITRGDETAISIFANSNLEVCKLMNTEDVIRAAVVATPKVIRMLCLMIALKIEPKAPADQPAKQVLDTSTHIYQEVPKEFLINMLHYSILGNNWQAFNELLHIEGIDLNEALHLTSSIGTYIDQSRPFGPVTPLQVSILSWQPTFAAALLEMGAKATPIPGHFLPGSPEQTTLLHVICRPSHIPLVMDGYWVFVTDENCKVDHPVRNENGQLATSYFIPPDFGTWKAVVRLLVRAGININAKDSAGFTPIRYLIRGDTGKESIRNKLEFLLELGASLDIAADVDSSYALDTCWLNGGISADTIEFVIQNTSSEIVDNGLAPFPDDKETPLREAALHGNTSVCRALISRGARVTVRDSLMFGRRSPGASSPTTVVFIPLNEVVDIPTGSRAAEVVLMYAQLEQNPSPDHWMMATECIDPHLNSCDIVGRTRLHIAVQREDAEAVQLLISKGALLNSPDWLGFAPLHFAYATDNQVLISMLENAQKSSPREIRFLDESDTTPPFSPSKMPNTLGEGRVRWDALCQAYDDEMKRRAELFPEVGFVIGAGMQQTAELRWGCFWLECISFGQLVRMLRF